MKQSEKHLQVCLKEHFSVIDNEDLLNFSEILHLAIRCDLMLEAYEHYLFKKYANVRVPFSQMFRNIDVLSLPVLDALLDKNNQINQFSAYKGEFKTQLKNLYETVQNEDLSVYARKQQLHRIKPFFKKTDKNIFPYQVLILEENKKGFELKLPIIYKQILYIFTDQIDEKLPHVLNKLEMKAYDKNKYICDLNELIELIKNVKNGVESLFELSQRFQSSKFKSKNLEVEDLVGKLIFFKQIDNIIPFSQIRGINDQFIRDLYGVKNDANSSLLRLIDQESGLFLSKSLLASLIYSTGKSEFYAIWKKFNVELQVIKEEIKNIENVTELKEIKAFFSQLKVKTFLYIMNITDLKFVEEIHDPAKVYFYLRRAKKDPVSRIRRIDKINDKFQFLKGD